MSDQKVNPNVKRKIDNLFDDDEDTTPTPNEVTEEKKEEVAAVSPVPEVKKVEKVEVKIDPTPIKKRIKTLFNECIESAKIKDKEGIVANYIDELYNPKTTKLDEGNLLLNLLTISRLQELNIIDFYFDETMKEYSSSEYHLDLDWYKKILEQPVEEQAKHVHILETNFKLSFYRAMFEGIVNSADKMSYTKNSVKMKNVWKFLDEGEESSNLGIEEYLVEFIQGKTVEGSIIMVTPDLVPFFKFDEKNEEEYVEKPYIKLVGKWNKRFIYELDITQISFLKGFKRGAFFIKEGNRYVINPEKPLVYYNTIDNPFVSKPILKLFASFDFKFFTSSTTFLRVEDM